MTPRRRIPPERLTRTAPWAVSLAGTTRTRARGLLGRRALGDHEALWLPVRSVHTVGMRVRLDLVWLGGGGGPLRVDVDVGPRRVRTCLAARGGVIEVRAGRGTLLAAALREGTSEGAGTPAATPGRPGPGCDCASLGTRAAPPCR